MKLCDVFDCSYDIEIRGIAEDSRLVKDGYIFFATKGYNVDHFNYIKEAIENGAIAVVCDREPLVDVERFFIVEDVRRCMIDVCRKYYDVSVEDFKFIGITGTDGKTTTAILISRLLGCGYIGTNGLIYKDIRLSTSNTTPTICELYKCLQVLKKENCKYISMEVSSEALLHCRVDHIKYDVVCFTNIVEDHLNIHKNIDNYIKSKLKLLKLVKKDGLIFINGDDKNCCQIIGDKVYSYGFDTCNNYCISNVKNLSKNVFFDLTFKNKKISIISPFLELFNIYNVCLAFIVCYNLGLDVDYLLFKIKDLDVVSGRCERLDFGQDYEIILDYAHTLNAVKSIVDHFKGKRTIVVTGAAGGREKEKRSRIGKYLLDNCDLVVFTMDDPRFEDVNEIIDQMIGKKKSNNNYLRIVDRKTAIYRALDIAKDFDAVLILGKGRDNYMAIEDRKDYYCDYDVICNYFKDK